MTEKKLLAAADAGLPLNDVPRVEPATFPLAGLTKLPPRGVAGELDWRKIGDRPISIPTITD